MKFSAWVRNQPIRRSKKHTKSWPCNFIPTRIVHRAQLRPSRLLAMLSRHSPMSISERITICSATMRAQQDEVTISRTLVSDMSMRMQEALSRTLRLRSSSICSLAEVFLRRRIISVSDVRRSITRRTMWVVGDEFKMSHQIKLSLSFVLFAARPVESRLWIDLALHHCFTFINIFHRWSALQSLTELVSF